MYETYFYGILPLHYMGYLSTLIYILVESFSHFNLVIDFVINIL